MIDSKFGTRSRIEIGVTRVFVVVLDLLRQWFDFPTLGPDQALVRVKPSSDLLLDDAPIEHERSAGRKIWPAT